MKFKLLLTFLLFTLIGCSNNNILISSILNKSYEFNKSEKIIIKASNNSNDSELEFVHILKETLIDDGFIIVDSLSQADRIFILSIIDSLNFGRVGYKSQSFGLSNYVFEKPTFEKIKGRHVLIMTKGYSHLSFVMYDTLQTRNNTHPWVWQSSIYAPYEKMIVNPAHTIRLLLNQYGITKEYYGDFPKPKK